ncbi:hypothetical protein [Hominenteromicrobium sp.]|uniref:hypothetical protein n=1 Tax=Hominenteromicrobium sp. TaxID=3073581 RepID=UPI003A95252E
MMIQLDLCLALCAEQQQELLIFKQTVEYFKIREAPMHLSEGYSKIVQNGCGFMLAFLCV